MEHVSHVASVASTIAKHLGVNEQLASAIALGHDIGHAPFGHHGEDCLNKLLEQKEGFNAPKKFWHERNSLFFADYIETLQDPSGVEQPLNLTYAVRDGLICHCGEIDQQGIKPRTEDIDLYSIKRPGLIQPFTWEGCVVKIADKIAIPICYVFTAGDKPPPYEKFPMYIFKQNLIPKHKHPYLYAFSRSL